MEVRIAIDSNRYTDFCRGEDEAVRVFRSAREIVVPLVVLAEQRAGFAYGSRREKNEQILTRFLNAKGIEVLCPDEQTTRVYAELYAYLRKKGTPIPTNDLWIAALVVQHDIVLFDRDSDFDRLPQVARIGSS